MEDGLAAAGVPLITALVFGALFMYKIIIGDNERLSQLTPVLAILLGCGFGLIAYYCTVDIMPANDVLSALLIGGASGLAATGTHQIFKQLSKSAKCKEATETDESLSADEAETPDAE